MSNRPRILHVVPADGLGGVETAARVMAETDSLKCHFRLLFIMGDTVAQRTDRILAPGGRRRYTPAALWRALRRALAERPDVLICSLWRSVPLTIAVKLLRPKVRVAYFVHNSRTSHVVDAFMSWIGMRLANEIWCDSPATLAARPTPARARTRIISFVTERRELVAQPVLGPRFVSWGRLHPQKGLDYAVELIAKLNERAIPAHLEAWGPDNGEGPALRALAERHGIADRVHFPGSISRDTLPTLAPNYAFYLQLSRYEGMAMAVVEAMQLGLVPVTTAVGQMAHYVRPGATGVIVDPENLDRAADELAELIVNEPVYAKLSAGARGYWASASLYADDICAAALALHSGPR